MSKEYAFSDEDTKSADSRTDRSRYFLVVFELLLLSVLLWLFFRDHFVTKILLENGTFLLALIILWSIVFISALATAVIKDDRKTKSVRIAALLLAFAVITGELVYSDKKAEFFYFSESTDLSGIITASEIFGEDSGIHEYPGTGNCRKQSPFPGTVTIKTNQYFTEGSFCSIRVDSFRWLRNRFKKEVLEQLKEKYGASLLYEVEQGIVSGSFQEENKTVRFFITEREDSMICVFFQGDRLIDQKVIFLTEQNN